jgi:hypothetical protein
MKSTPVHDHGVMEEKGSYNRYSRIPAGGMSLALPRLQEAVQGRTRLDEQPVVVADYGSSQGKNSLAPMRVEPGISTELVVTVALVYAHDFHYGRPHDIAGRTSAAEGLEPGKCVPHRGVSAMTA